MRSEARRTSLTREKVLRGVRQADQVLATEAQQVQPTQQDLVAEDLAAEVTK